MYDYGERDGLSIKISKFRGIVKKFMEGEKLNSKAMKKYGLDSSEIEFLQQEVYLPSKIKI